MTDSQRSRVYDAQDTAATAVGMYAYRQTIPNDKLQAYVDKVLSRKPVRARWRNRTIEAQLKRGGSAYGYGNRITLPLFARNEWVILHEIAHCLNHHGEAHGPEFAGTYLFLVRTVLGAEAGKALLKAYRTKGRRVRYTMDMIPAPRDVPTLTEIRARAASENNRPVSTVQRRETASVIRALVKQGEFGPSGRKTRTAALAVARQLEGASS